MNEIRLAASATLVGAGLLGVAAGYERWWPACRPGQIDSRACEVVQDHRFDYVIPAAPFEAIGQALWLQGFSYLLLASAFCLLATMVEGGAILRTNYCFLAISTGLTASAAFWAAGVGRPFNFAGPATFLPHLMVVGFLLLPVVCLFSGIGASRISDRVFFLLLAASSPFVELFLAPIFVGGWSYDTAAWSGAVSGWCLVVAGLACAVGIRRTTEHASAAETVVA